MEGLSDSLREIVTCTVCLDMLSIPLVQCMQGHAMCHGCKGNQRQCPSCRKPFLPDKPILLTQILQQLPTGKCKFSGCSYVLQGGQDDHQVWCGFRPSSCKICNWSGYTKNVRNHVKTEHKNIPVLSPGDYPVKEFRDRIQEQRLFIPFLAHDLFFWLQISLCCLSCKSPWSLLMLKLILVPDKKTDSELYLKVDYKTIGCEYFIKNNIELHPSSEDASKTNNYAFIPNSNKANESVSIDVIKVSNLINRVNKYYSSSINKISESYQNKQRYLADILPQVRVLVCSVVFFYCINLFIQIITEQFLSYQHL